MQPEDIVLDREEYNTALSAERKTTAVSFLSEVLEGSPGDTELNGTLK